MMVVVFSTRLLIALEELKETLEVDTAILRLVQVADRQEYKNRVADQTSKIFDNCMLFASDITGSEAMMESGDTMFRPRYSST